MSFFSYVSQNNFCQIGPAQFWIIFYQNLGHLEVCDSWKKTNPIHESLKWQQFFRYFCLHLYRESYLQYVKKWPNLLICIHWATDLATCTRYQNPILTSLSMSQVTIFWNGRRQYRTFPVIVGCLPALHSLQISHNKLKRAEDIDHLIQCTTVSVVDLSHNKLDDERVVEVFESMAHLVSIENYHPKG